jgi:DNA-binding PucR family transcriptional regulator
MPRLLRGDNAVSLLLRSMAPAGSRVAVGVSDPLHDLAGIPDAVQEADTALLVSRRTRGGAVTRFSETGAFGLLAPLRETAVARRVIGQLLEPLLAYDEQHNAALTETLQTYIACNGNASMTAGRLNLHRNSLSYRLRRIEELAGLSLGDAENRLLLALALRLHQLR